MRSFAWCLAAAAASFAAANEAKIPSYLGLRSLADVKARRAELRMPIDAAPRAVTDAASMSVSPAVLDGAGGNVTLSWAGVSGSSTIDWIGVYCVGSNDTDFLDWFYSNSATGSGSATYTLYNVGCDMEFRYFMPHYFQKVATSNAVTFTSANGTEPFALRLAYGDDPSTSMYVSWTSYNGDLVPFVLVGEEPGVYTRRFVGDTTTYYAEDMCGAPASDPSVLNFLFTGWHAHVLLEGLKPNTRYYYIVGQAANVTSAETSFVTGKAVGPEVATKWIMYADMGYWGAPASQQTAARVLERLNTTNDIDFVAHPGDVAYALGHAYIWPIFQAIIAPYASRLPYLLTVGNHEYDHTGDCGAWDPSGATGSGYHPVWGDFGNDSGGEMGVPVAHRFRSPSNGNGIFWYSMNTGSVHNIFLSSEHSVEAGSPMMTWLAADLAAVNRSLTPWVILNLHRPIYNSEDYLGDYAVCLAYQKLLEPLLLQYKVDLVLAGHYHSYLRTVPVANGVPDPAGIVHLTIGSAGASLDDVGLVPNNYTVTHNYAFGFGVVTAHNSSALQVDYVLNESGEVWDTTWIFHA